LVSKTKKKNLLVGFSKLKKVEIVLCDIVKELFSSQNNCESKEKVSRLVFPKGKFGFWLVCQKGE
jgi:hypothetical protein